MKPSVSFHLAKRTRRRKLTSGATVNHERWFLDYRDPVIGKRRIKAFDTRQDALAYRDQLFGDIQSGTHHDPRSVPTVSEAIDHYIADRDGKVKGNTFAGYKIVVERIRGPLLVGTARQRAVHTRTGILPDGTKLVSMLGDCKINELTPADIRVWHNTLAEVSGAYTARRAMTHLRALLALAEEDFGVRAASMPRNVGRTRHRMKKVILGPAEIARVLNEARQDKQYGTYYAFGFLAGTRPSEQLGLLWDAVDFDNNVINIRRMQERDGSLTELTKTEAGERSIPMCATLRAMFLEWRLSCPRRLGKLERVFPGHGRLQAWPKPRIGGGGALLYQNFRRRIWVPVFTRLGLPYVTPHSARHSWISTLQMQGVEVGLVAKLAGHSNAAVTLGHYTQAMRGGQEAIGALEQAYRTTP